MFEQSGEEICNENVFVGNFGQEETQQFAQSGADDNNDEEDDDMYIMMKCVFVCHKKSSLPLWPS